MPVHASRAAAPLPFGPMVRAPAPAPAPPSLPRQAPSSMELQSMASMLGGMGPTHGSLPQGHGGGWDEPVDRRMDGGSGFGGRGGRGGGGEGIAAVHLLPSMLRNRIEVRSEAV